MYFSALKKKIKKLMNSLKNYLKKHLPLRYLNEPFKFKRADKSCIRLLKNKYYGERCFIIGNGPSLNKLDLNLLNNDYSFGVNGIFYKTKEMGFTPSFYVVEDAHVINDNLHTINNYDVKHKFFPSIYWPRIMKNSNVTFFNMNRSFYEPKSQYYTIPRFSMDCSEKIYCGQSVTIINLQLAYFMGFTKVYLIGMDFSYQIPETAEVEGHHITSTEDDPNHFHPDYFGKGKKWHDPKLDRVMKSYKLCKLMYELDGREIINATSGGKLDIFRRENYDDLF